VTASGSRSASVSTSFSATATSSGSPTAGSGPAIRVEATLYLYPLAAGVWGSYGIDDAMQVAAGLICDLSRLTDVNASSIKVTTLTLPVLLPATPSPTASLPPLPVGCAWVADNSSSSGGGSSTATAGTGQLSIVCVSASPSASVAAATLSGTSTASGTASAAGSATRSTTNTPATASSTPTHLGVVPTQSAPNTPSSAPTVVPASPGSIAAPGGAASSVSGVPAPPMDAPSSLPLPPQYAYVTRSLGLHDFPNTVSDGACAGIAFAAQQAAVYGGAGRRAAARSGGESSLQDAALHEEGDPRSVRGAAAGPQLRQLQAASGGRAPGLSFHVVLELNGTRLARKATANVDIVATVAQQIAAAASGASGGGSEGTGSGSTGSTTAASPLQLFAAMSALWVRLNGFSLFGGNTMIVDANGQPLPAAATAFLGGSTVTHGSEQGQQSPPPQPTQYNTQLLAAIIGGAAGAAVLLLAVVAAVHLYRRRIGSGVTYV